MEAGYQAAVHDVIRSLGFSPGYVSFVEGNVKFDDQRVIVNCTCLSTQPVGDFIFPLKPSFKLRF